MELDTVSIAGIASLIVTLISGLLYTNAKWRRVARIVDEGIDLLYDVKEAVKASSPGGEKITPEEAEEIIKEIEEFIKAWES